MPSKRPREHCLDRNEFIGCPLYERTCCGGLQNYTQVVTITNNLRASVEPSIRCGTTDRYVVTPANIYLKPVQSCGIEVKLQVQRFAQKRKAAEQGQKDYFHIKVCLVACVVMRLSTT